MAYDPGALDSALAAAVGDDPALVAELRAVFFESAAKHLDAMKRASSDADWQIAAKRMMGLAASFGVTRLIDAAGNAADAPRGDATALRQVVRSIDSFGG